MKKWMALLLVVALMFTAFACAQPAAQTETPAEEAPASEAPAEVPRKKRPKRPPREPPM